VPPGTREAEAEDRADIGLAHVGDDVILDGARGFHRLHDKKTLLQLLNVERVRIEVFRLQPAQLGPKALLALALSG